MSNHYHSHIFTHPLHEGWAFESRLYADDLGRPWEVYDTMGKVRVVRASPYSPYSRYSYHNNATGKRPGERILDWTDGAGWAYDWLGAVKEARRHGARGPDAVAAANEEFDYLRGWLNNVWHWCGVEVRVIKCPPQFKRCLDDQDALSQSRWGIESNAADYLADMAKVLAGDCFVAAKRAVLAYEAANPICPCCGQRSPLAARAGLGSQVEDVGDDAQDNSGDQE